MSFQTEEITKLHPFLKWVGGKRWFVEQHRNIFPTDYCRYVEPFLGSAAVFFTLRPKRAILSDINGKLIETYKAIKNDWETVLGLLQKHHHSHSENYYYGVRDSLPRKVHTRAARFIYLNRTCWNGLYRVNRSGRFNVPIGSRTNVVRDTDNFQAVSALLERARLVTADFEHIIAKTHKGDLLFVDPPYTVRHDNNNFRRYNERLFSWSDQVRLRDCLVKAFGRGVSVVMTNANHPSIRRLYRDSFELTTVERISHIAADVNKRGRAKELLIRRIQQPTALGPTDVYS